MTNKYYLSSVSDFDFLANNVEVDASNVLFLKNIDCHSINSKYRIIRYDKTFLNHESAKNIGLCRSVVLNNCNNVIGFSPPKSIDADAFMNKYPVLKNNIIAEEYIEGTMINVFYDKSVGIWELSTKNTVGANTRFFSIENGKTFREMFWEAADYCGLDINKLNKDFSYSFVLQHPENRIVIPIHVPYLYLVAVYNMYKEDNSTVVISFHSHEFKMYSTYLTKETRVGFQQIYEFGSYADLIEKYASNNTPYTIMGVVMHNIETGERTKIRNPVYEKVRQLRGNQPKLQYHYLCLRKENKVKEYLEYYPEHIAIFTLYRDAVHTFTNELYDNYVACYICKSKPLIEYSVKYRTHMYNLHHIFLDKLKENKQKINIYLVQTYVNEMHPSLLMHCLNHET